MIGQSSLPSYSVVQYGGTFDFRSVELIDFDAIKGSTGHDVIYASAFFDTATASFKGAVVEGDAGNDTIEGTAYADTLNGGAGTYVLDGKAGNDILIGGASSDTLTGGTGADTFRFTATGDSSQTLPDTILDFSSAAFMQCAPDEKGGRHHASPNLQYTSFTKEPK